MKHGKPLTQAQCDRAKLLYQIHPWNTVCELMGIGTATLVALKRRNFKAAVRAKRPMPSDFRLIAEGKNQAWLMEHYRTSGRTITRWRAEAGFSPPPGGRRYHPVPFDLKPTYANLGTVKATAAHYGVHPETVRRWIKAAGLRTPRAPEPTPRAWDQWYGEQSRRAG